MDNIMTQNECFLLHIEKILICCPRNKNFTADN